MMIVSFLTMMVVFHVHFVTLRHSRAPPQIPYCKYQ